MRPRLNALHRRHRQLGVLIREEMRSPLPDTLLLRLKHRKLRLKDEINLVLPMSA